MAFNLTLSIYIIKYTTFLYCVIETIWLVDSSMTDTVVWPCLS